MSNPQLLHYDVIQIYFVCKSMVLILRILLQIQVKNYCCINSIVIKLFKKITQKSSDHLQFSRNSEHLAYLYIANIYIAHSYFIAYK